MTDAEATRILAGNPELRQVGDQLHQLARDERALRRQGQHEAAAAKGTEYDRVQQEYARMWDEAERPAPKQEWML